MFIRACEIIQTLGAGGSSRCPPTPSSPVRRRTMCGSIRRRDRRFSNPHQAVPLAFDAAVSSFSGASSL